MEVGIGIPGERMDGYQPIMLLFDKDVMQALEQFCGKEIKNRDDIKDAITIWITATLIAVDVKDCN